MKLFEKLIIIIAIIAGCAAAVIILTLAPGSGTTVKERTLAPYKAPRESEGLVTFTSGEVFFFRQGGWKPIQIGELIKTDDFIKTFEKSACEIQVGERVLYSILENTVIQIRDVFQASGAVKSECELFAGSILCKVEKLVGEERVGIRSGAKAFGVRGTVFMIQRQDGEITCAVKDGRVAILKSDTGAQESLVLPGQEVIIDETLGRIGSPGLLAATRKTLLEKIAATKYISLAREAEPKLVKIALEVEPSAAEIIVDGKRAGFGTYARIVSAGTQLPVILRKAGYREQRFTITVKQGDNRIYRFKLELDDPEKGIGGDKQADEENRLIERLETDVRTLIRENKTLKEKIGTLQADNIGLAKELEAAKDRIKSALDQLQQ